MDMIASGSPLSRALVLAAATVALVGCGGSDSGSDGGSGGTQNGGGGNGGSSTKGPTVDLKLLAKLCPNYDATSKTYSHCKTTNDATVNAVLSDINAWIAANSPTNKVAAGPDASYKVAAGDSCSFSLEPGLGIWMMTLKNAAGPNVTWTGTAMDAAQVDANGIIIYMSASTDSTGAGFINAAGQMEINFPGATNGSISEAVYGHDSKFVSCTMHS